MEGKMADCDESAIKQPHFCMPLNFCENQGLFAAAEKAKSVTSALKTDKANLGETSTSLPIVTFAQNSGRNMRTDQGAVVNQASAGYNMVLPNPPKSLSQIPMFNNMLPRLLLPILMKL
jgi:hypothetical protein